MSERKVFHMGAGMPPAFVAEPDVEIRTDAKPMLSGAHRDAEAGYEHPGDVFQMDSGLWALEPGTLRAWIKFSGEPALTLFETPQIFTERWLRFVHDSEQEVCWAHQYSEGQAFAIFRPAIPHLWTIGITFQSTGPRPVARSVWNHKCDCPVCQA